MGDVKDDVAVLFAKDEEADVDDAKIAEEQKALAELSAKEEFDAKTALLHEELAKVMDGRGEGNIGLSDPYWAARDRLQQHLHSAKV